jgi:hypothetical protein
LFLDDIVHDSGPFPPPLGRASMKTVVMFLSPIVVDRGEHCTKPKAPTAANGLPAGLETPGLAQRPTWRALCAGASNVSLCATTPKVF